MCVFIIIFLYLEPCNCINNDNSLRSDEGYLETKSYLPIRALLYGDTGSSSEYLDSTLGPLKCYFNDRMYIMTTINLTNFVPSARFCFSVDGK